MSDAVVAKRYAKALFEIASEQGRISEVEAELKAVVEALKANPDIYKVIKNPTVEASAKKDILKQCFEAAVSEPVLNMLNLLIDRRREEALEFVVLDYVKIAGEALGQADGTVFTPVELSEAELSSIAAAFGELTGKQIRVKSVIDKSLLGGIQVRIGDRLYDGSLAGKLNRLQKMLNESQAL
ncbi:F0F1 ATP synthase subunit delta [Paenibacillus ginsengihumi]|jgi:F-type H+-transporting ATPase subunit delta|uniref:F0F1 ATP synthase subunit delta n=1 Tax=Paenibacillus ginsengihumi TaxID=431596 RepID=UPI000363A92F|nr:F0F1 ATP synthase subunit delta [Paenibacillus ginsengihumi]